MRRTVILRIAPAALRAGRLAGEAESIATGERKRVQSQEDLLDFIRADECPADTLQPPDMTTKESQ
jgi:hypothetical protein